MSTGERAHLLQLAVDAAGIGGGIVSSRFRRASGIETKAPGDYVSEADHSSEDAVREALDRGAPGIPFFGEEHGGTRAALGWVVDPLDGTANFLHGFPVVGVSVALLEEGRPVIGVVHAPLLGATWSAATGLGAVCNGEPLTVSERLPAQAICATGFPFRQKHLLPRFLGVMRQALERFEDLRRAGAATLDLAWTSSGVYDGFFELSLGPWDVAAGAVLVREAGGVVTDWQGHPDAWLETGDILAAPPQVHEALLTLVASGDAADA